MKDRIVPCLKLLGTGVKMQTGEVEAVSMFWSHVPICVKTVEVER